jgi:hypothetical protein
VLSLLLVVVLIGAVLTAALWVGTLFLQGYLYTEPSGGVFWQAPLAAAVLTFFYLFWSLLNVWDGTVVDGRVEIPYGILWSFSNRVDLSPEPVAEFESKRKNESEVEVFKLEKSPHEIKYKRVDKNEYWSPVGVEWVKFKDKDGKEYKFDPIPTPKGGNRVFVDHEHGWEMTDIRPGQASYTSFGRLLVYFLLNAMHLAVWIVCLWLVLRFAPSHAIGLGVVMWLLFTLAVFPGLFSRAAAAVQPLAA